VHLHILFVWILIKVVDSFGVEAGASSFNSMYNVSFTKQQFCEVSAVLARDTGD
jgi:hypothetical protein